MLFDPPRYELNVSIHRKFNNVKLKLETNLGFAVNKYAEPEVWAQITGEQLGLRSVQFVADLLNPFLPDDYTDSQIKRIQEAVKRYDLAVDSIFTPAFTRVNHLTHPDERDPYRWIAALGYEEILRKELKIFDTWNSSYNSTRNDRAAALGSMKTLGAGRLVMTVNPGFAGQALASQSPDKIARLRALYPSLTIEADGNVSFENAAKMRRAGADLFVAGTSSMFQQGASPAENTKNSVRQSRNGKLRFREKQKHRKS
jgi:hypothetical protein